VKKRKSSVQTAIERSGKNTNHNIKNKQPQENIHNNYNYNWEKNVSAIYFPHFWMPNNILNKLCCLPR